MRSGEVTYALPGPADAEAIARLHVESWRETYEGMIPPDILADSDLADRTLRWRSYLEISGYPTFLAQAEGTAAGFIRAGRLGEPLVEDADGHIYALYILQRFHRRGIGRKLMGLAAEAWLQQGGKAFSVGVLSANLGARAFYEALGARYVRPDVEVWQDHSLPESIYLFENLPDLSSFA
jgi:ribosomal protein S18 acetylase RimI-like enzyme